MRYLERLTRDPGPFLLIATATFAGMFSTLGCTASDSASGSGGSTGTTGSFVQVERLARPVINEGLVFTNSFLNAFNSISPDLDLSDAAAAVRAEVVQVLDAVDAADANDNVDANTIASIFLPDVMRIDTTQNLPPGTTAYSGAANAAGVLTGGRKIEDDVMDITLTVLVGATVTDNVSYTRPATGPGSTNTAIGHNLLNGQAAPGGAATFPFLAPPN